MRRSLTLLALCLVLSLGALAADDREVAALLGRAELWQSRNRDDLAREELDRVFRIAPDNPEGLVLLARIQLRANQDAEAAKTYERLRKAHPGHPGVAQLSAQLRIRGADKEKLRQARQLARAGRPDEALKAYRSLFPDGFPDDELALEYAQALGATAGGWEQSRAMLADLSARHPGDPKYRLALAAHVSTRKPASPESMRTLRELSSDPAVSKQAREAWRRAVLRLDPVEESVASLREYLAAVPDDAGVTQQLEATTKAVDQQRRELADPANRAKREATALLDAGKVDEAEARLKETLARRPNDGEAIGSMGLVRLRQGRHDEARELFARARQLDAPNRARWEGLERTALYWGSLQQAGKAREAGDPATAERLLLEARALDPREPNGAIDLALVRVAQGRLEEAERLYREALALAPGNARAVEGLVGLLLRADREKDAQEVIASLAPGQRREIDGAIGVLRAEYLRDQARKMKAQSRTGEAIAALEEAVRLDPANPWARFDLARLYAAAGDAERGRALFDPPMQKRPVDPDAAYALALYLSGIDRDSEALATLERIPRAARSPGMTGLQRRLWFSVQSQRAAAMSKAGRPDDARRVLASARDAAGDDAELALVVAGAYVTIGDPAAARGVLARFSAPPARPTLDWRIGEARLLDRMAADAELRASLDAIAAAGAATREQQEAIAELRLSLGLRQAKELRAQGRRDEAAEAYRALLAAKPGDAEAELALAETLVEAGRRDEARDLVARLRNSPRAADPDYATALAADLFALEDYEGARPLVEAALRARPDHSRALELAGRLALRDGKVDQSIALQQRALAAEASRRAVDDTARLSRIARPATVGEPLVVEAAPAESVARERSWQNRFRPLAELLDQEPSWLSSAVDWRYRSGENAKGRISSQEVPLEWKQGWSPVGRWFVRADLARVNAGALDLSDANPASTFGSVLLCQPACTSGSLPQLESGVAFGAGLERDGLRIDVGSSPTGFPVVNLLGGILFKGDLGPASYSVDASRRSVTSSLLSWAGTADPNTGRTWGGVVATGVRLGLSRDSGGDYGAWSSLGLHRLTGRNVQDNDRVQLMAGAYRRFLNEEDRQLAMGLTGMWWRHSENAGEFTFGHGGYYSPRTYGSLALPLTYALRTERWSFAMRASVSVARSESKRAPYFPTDPELQAQAVALAPVNGVDPYYPGGNDGRSYGRALGAALEYQLLPGLFAGARAEFERSTNYTPNRFLLYLRVAPDRPSARPVPMPPEPVLPSSQF